MDSISPIRKSIKVAGRFLDQNSPTILTWLGVSGLAGSIIFAVKSTPKALELIAEEEKSRQADFDDENYNVPLTFLDKVSLAWKCYIPTAALALSTTICIVGANSISIRRNAALASLFSITETALREYQAKVVEEIGEKKEEKIRGEIAQDKIDKNPPKDGTIVMTGKGNYLCYDSFSGRYFRSDVSILQKAENEFNRRLLREMWLPINEFYYEIGLDSIELGDEMGWIAEKALLELKFSSKITKDKEPCLVIDYRVTPYHI